MARIINIREALENAPRPIYLIGNAEYETKERSHFLTATAFFPSHIPSIEDRIKKHLIPHINIGDAFFGVWNATYLIGKESGYHGTLSNKGKYEAYIPIPPDENINLELTVKEIEHLIKSKFDIKVGFEAYYKKDSRVLMKLSGEGYAIRKVVIP